MDCFEKEDTIWFKLADIAKLLDISESATRKMKHEHWFDKEEMCIKNTNTSEIINVTESNTSLGRGYMMYVSESALYRILNRSNSPKAKPFERWVTKEVIPNIRKKGGYITEKGVENILSNSLYIVKLVNTSARMLLEMRQELDEKNKVIEIQTPKAEFYDTVTKSESTFDMNEVAKLLNIPGMGAVKLFGFLRDNKILSDVKTNWNEPYQTYVNSGYFKIVETKQEDKYGKVHVHKKTVVFQKGVDFIRNLLKKEGLAPRHVVPLF